MTISPPPDPLRGRNIPREGAPRRSRRERPAVDPRVARSKALIATALVALLQDRELDAITVRDIAGRSGVGYTTFYRHYETKEDLVSEVAEAEVGRLADLIFPHVVTGDSFDAALLSSRCIAERRPLWFALTSRMCAAILREKFVATMISHAEGLTIGSDLFPREMTASLAATILVEIMTWWLRESDDAAPDMLAHAIDRTIIKPALTSW